MEKLKQNWPMVLLMLAIGACIFILNIATLISPDDYSYALMIAGDDLKINSFSEIFNCGKYLYFNWTGRILPHILIGMVMCTSVGLFKIINTLIFLVFLWIITKFITGKTSYLSIIVAFGFLIYGKMFGEKIAWISGSLNYLWTTTALIAYLYTFYGYFVENRTLKKWQKWFIAVGGMLIASSHEVMTFVGGAFLGIVFLMKIRKWKDFTKDDKLFFIGSMCFFGIGGLFTILAPGNVARSTLDVNENKSPFACLTPYKDCKIQVILMILSIVAIGFLKKKELIKKQIIYFLLPCLIATIPFAVIGYFTPRAFLPYEALMIMIVSANIQQICEYFKEYKKWIVIVAIILTGIVFARMLPTTYSDIRYILPYKIKMTKQLEEAKKNHEKDVIVSKFLFMDKIRREDLINVDNFFIETDSNCVVNVFLAQYYGFEKVRAISDIDYFVEIQTDIENTVDYGIIDKNTLELIGIVPASTQLDFSMPIEKWGIYVVDCRDKDLRSHVKSVRVRGVHKELENPDIEELINQEK